MSGSLVLVAVLSVASGISSFSPTLPPTHTPPDHVAPAALDSLLRSSLDSTPNPRRPANPLTVFAFLSTECPLSRNQVLALNRLIVDDSVTVLGLIPRLGSDDAGLTTLALFLKETGAGFPLAGDPHLIWTNRLDATITPEVFLIDSAGTVVYSGAVDDWMVTLGRKRPAPTQHYLRDAIEAVRTKRPVEVSRMPAVGCRIE